MRSPMLFPYRFSQGDTYFIASVSDLPSPQAGVITLPAGTSYFITGALDLVGARIECAGPVCILGTSPETCSITSTGLTSSTIISSTYSLTLRDLTVTTPAGCTGVSLDGSGGGDPIAVDWYGVNWRGTGRSVILEAIDNAVMILMGWLGSDGILVNGSANTIAITESIFSMFDSGQKALSFGVGAVINRRLRIESCAAPIGSGATGFDVASANIANPEAFILNRVNFSAGGTYLGALTYLNDKARFDECRGIQNSSRVGAMSWTGNATATTISTVGVAVKAAATSTASPINQRFSHTNNRLTYTSAITETFIVTANVSLESGNNNQCGIYLYKNGVLIPGGLNTITTNGSGRAEGGSVQAVVELAQGDYIELWVANNTGVNNITVTDGNIIARGLS